MGTAAFEIHLSTRQAIAEASAESKSANYCLGKIILTTFVLIFG